MLSTVDWKDIGSGFSSLIGTIAGLGCMAAKENDNAVCNVTAVGEYRLHGDTTMTLPQLPKHEQRRKRISKI